LKAPEAKAPLKLETPLAKDPSQMSVAEILAAARAGKGGAAPPAKAPAQAPASVAVAPSGEEPSVEEPAAEEAAPQANVASSKPSAPAGELPTKTADIIAWCRARDSK
jgi:hypothetical protein